MGFTLTKKRFLIWKTVMMVVAGLVVGGAIKLFWRSIILPGFLLFLCIFISSDGIIFLCSTTVGSIRRISCFPSIWE